MNNFNFNMWLIVAVAAISFIQWAARKAREQQIKNERKRSQQRAYEESLRTGRSQDNRPALAKQSAHDVQQARLRELAEMRRRQLEELRRQQREAATKKRAPSVRMPSTPGTASSTSRLPKAGPVSSGTIVRPGAPKPASGRAGSSRSGGSAQRAPGRLEPQRQPAGTRPPAKQTTAPAVSAEPAAMARLASVKGTEIGADPVAGAKPAHLAVDWRRAMVLSEVLGAPVALRGTADQGERAW